MPKISAPTVKEHHDTMATRIIDAAEDVLRYFGPEKLTAGEVAKRSGIARNSIYRYVDSIDDLRVKVAERYILRWQTKLLESTIGISDPREQVLVRSWTALELASELGHRWLIEMVHQRRGKSSTGGEYGLESVQRFHRLVASTITEPVMEIRPHDARLISRLIGSMLNTAMATIDDGAPLTSVEPPVLAAIAALVDAADIFQRGSLVSESSQPSVSRHR